MRTLKYVLSVSKDISSSLYSVGRERLQARIGELETVLGQRAWCLRDINSIKSPLPLWAISLILRAVTPP